MARALPIAFAVSLGAALAAAMSCSQELSADECHRDAVERYGCCPVCDSDCRATISADCAEAHDSPLVEQSDDVNEGASSSDGSSASPHSSSEPIW